MAFRIMWTATYAINYPTYVQRQGYRKQANSLNTTQRVFRAHIELRSLTISMHIIDTGRLHYKRLV
jgi:hypothetical protein